jgi:hypothetical protein
LGGIILFPNNFRIEIVDVVTEKPIKNIVTMITIFANRKNNYILLPPLSNDNGAIEFSKEWIREGIKKEQNLFIMDYSSPLEDCKAKMQVDVLGSEGIEKLASGMKLFKEYYGYTNEDINSVLNANNLKYKPKSEEISFSGEKSLTLQVKLVKFKP